MTRRLEDKVAIVTGGGRGIGAAIAKAFAAEGARIVVCGREPGPIKTIAAAVGGIAQQADVSVETDVASVVAACRDAYGRLDILVNNAGLQGPVGPAETMDLAAWDQTFAVNVRGVLLFIMHAVPMLRQSRGSIINISSRVGLSGFPTANRSAYQASKFALTGLTEAVAQELGPDGIRVNSLCPSAVKTEPILASIARKARAQGRSEAEVMRNEYESVTALGRMVEAEEVAAAAVYLASDDAAAITGTHLKVDAAKR